MTPRVNANDVERAVATYLTRALSEPEQLEIAINNYLSGLESRIFEAGKTVRPLEQEIEEVRAKIKRANDLFIVGNLDQRAYGEVYGPLKQKLDNLEAKNGVSRPEREHLERLHQDKLAIQQAMENTSLVAAVSYLNGLTLLEVRPDEERHEMVRKNNGHSGGIAGINAINYTAELGTMDFTQVLNILSVNVWVSPTGIKVDGLIPMNIPMDDITVGIPKLNGGSGYSKNNQFPRIIRLRPWRLNGQPILSIALLWRAGLQTRG